MFSHARIEKNSILLTVLTLIVVSIGGLVEIAPLFYLESTIEKVKGMRPYTPLELKGRNILVSGAQLLVVNVTATTENFTFGHELASFFSHSHGFTI